MDTNALGEQDSFLFGALWSPSSLFGMATFSVQAKDIMHPGFSISATSSKGQTTTTDEEKNEIFEYDRVTFGGGLTITEKLTKYLSLNVGCSYSYLNADDTNEYEPFPIDRFQRITPNISLALGTSDWNGVFISQKSVGAGFSLGFCDYFGDADKSKTKEFSVKVVLQQPIFDTFRLMIAANGFYSIDSNVNEYQGEGAAGVSILADDFSSAKIAGGSAGFEWAFAQSKYATFSTYALYEAAVFTNYEDEKCFEHGPEFGMKAYLKKIAVPALSFGLSYNVVQEFWNYSFAFGASF